MRACTFKKTAKKTAFILLLLTMFTGCNKNEFPLGMTDEPEDSPKYDVQADRNYTAAEQAAK